MTADTTKPRPDTWPATLAQPMPQPSTGPSMHDVVADQVAAFGAQSRHPYIRKAAPAVVADLGARRDLGLAKYHQPLQAGNGRSALVDLYQELLDAAVYAEQATREGGLKFLVGESLVRMLVDVRAVISERDPGTEAPA